MPIFEYNARDRQGNALKGTFDAPTEAVAQGMVRDKDWILLNLTEAEDSSTSRLFQSLTKGVKSKEIVVFARQLAVLISATVPIVRALHILARQSESKNLRDVVTHIADDVDGGSRLSAAMHREARVFDDFFVHMIRAGETTGRLDEVLVYLADEKEKDYQLVSKIISTMIYPAFIVVMLGVIFIFMMIYVVPKLLDVVTTSGAELPWVTKVLIGISDFFQNYWWLVLAVILIGAVAWVVAKSQENGRRFIDRIKLSIPVLGKIFQKVYLVRVSRSLANLLASGVPVNRSIEIVSDVVGNHVYKDVLLRARDAVESGNALSQSFATSKYVPAMMTQMMSIGEETGRLDQILVKVADFYVAEVNSLTAALVSLVEPVIIIMLGAGALLLVTGIMLPIYSITGFL